MYRAEADRDHAHVVIARRARRLLDDAVILPALAVGEEHEGALRRAVGCEQELHPLLQRRRNRTAGLAGHRRIKVLEVEIDRARVRGEWREHVAAPGEGDQREAMCGAARPQATDLGAHPIQPRRSLVGGEHRLRHVDGQHHIGAFTRSRRALLAPSRAQEGHRGEYRSEAEPDGTPPGGARDARRGEALHERRIAKTRQPEAPSAPRDQQQHDDDHGRSERDECQRAIGEQSDHGSGPRHASSASSSTSSASAMPSGMR